MKTKDIYVAGDISAYVEPETGRPTPQIVQAAEGTGHTAAANIVAKIKGEENILINQIILALWYLSVQNGALLTLWRHFI